MSKIIRDVSRDIKCKVSNADRDIRKAIERKEEYPSLATTYYNFSINELNEAIELHEEVVGFIEQYRNENGEPPKTMLELWEFEHNNIMSDVADIKILQEHYRKL